MRIFLGVHNSTTTYCKNWMITKRVHDKTNAFIISRITLLDFRHCTFSIHPIMSNNSWINLLHNKMLNFIIYIFKLKLKPKLRWIAYKLFWAAFVVDNIQHIASFDMQKLSIMYSYSYYLFESGSIKMLFTGSFHIQFTREYIRDLRIYITYSRYVFIIYYNF